MGLSAVESINSGGKAMTSRSGGRRRGWNGRRGTPWWRDAQGGVEVVRE
jgi:hypothetical protein